MTDYLSRQPYLDLLKSIISNQKENPIGYSFAIDGEWGAGKTWILQELEKQLLEEKDNKYLIFHYNAWENDFYDEPLVAILSVIISEIEKICKKEQVIEGINANLAATSLVLLKNLAISFVNTTAQNKIGIDFRDIVDDLKSVKDATSELKNIEKQVDVFLPLKNGTETIKKQVLELSKYAKILFIVDELDRCLPEYAIKVLERLHHICNEMPVIQILAIDKKNLADSISSVFGKKFYNSQYSFEQTNQFADSYLQKFVDVIIPLPIGKLDNRLEVLNGLEKRFKPYIRKDIAERDFINLDENFLADCITSIMNGVERRLQEKIFKQVSLCHELTIQSGVEYDEERLNYDFLIYEIISCISRYVFHSNKSFRIRESSNKQDFVLSFYQFDESSRTVYESEHEIIKSNIESFFTVSENQIGDAKFIHDTKSYLMAFFAVKPKFSSWTFESSVWDWIEEDKVFLQKFNEIMNLLVVNDK